MSEPPRGPLAGLRVVETGGVSAALAGRWLADMGAEVWKVEPPGGDASRRWPPVPGTNFPASLFFEFYNTGKRSVVLDPSIGPDRSALRDLVVDADVWLDAWPRPGDAEWGLDDADLAAASARLIVARVTPFGESGPFASYRATDLVAQAAGGMVFTNGFPDEPPLQGFGLQAYHAASSYVLVGVLAALFERERSGLGQKVEVSLQEATAGAVEESSAAWNGERRIEVRRGTIHWSRAFGVCRARDGFVLCSTVGDWTTLREWMRCEGQGGELDGPEWDEFPYRRDHAEALFAALGRFVAEYDTAELLEAAQLRRLPFAPVRPPTALVDDPQLVDRGFFAPIEGGLVFPGPPFRMSRTPLRTPRPAAPPLDTTGGRKRGHSSFPPALAGRGVAEIRNVPVSAGALEGVRVLDFTHVVAGPVATRILADHGAEVIKIERRTTLDLGDRRRGFFSNLNRGKKSLILNMADPRGVELARRLAAVSDVVIDNFSARVMGNWGLDYEGLRRLRPDVVAIGMSGFGQTGPARHWVSFGPTLHALSGHTWLMRHGAEPAGWGFSHSDMCGGLAGAIAAIAALYHRRRTGEGQRIDLSQLESVIAFMGPALLVIANGLGVVEPPANRSQEAPGAPHGVYRSLGDDRWIAIAVLDDETWARFARALGEPWAAEPALRSSEERLARAAELDRLVESWTRRLSPEEATALLQQAGVPAFTVANGEDVCERDAHLRARGYWARLPTPEGGIAVVDGVPARLARTPGRVVAPGPLHGEHTDAVLRGVLGLADDEIGELRAAGVVA